MSSWFDVANLSIFGTVFAFIAGIFGYGKFVANIQARGKSNSHRLDEISEDLKKIKDEVDDLDTKQTLNDGKLDLLIRGQGQTQDLLKTLIEKNIKND